MNRTRALELCPSHDKDDIMMIKLLQFSQLFIVGFKLGTISITEATQTNEE